ncbi:PulJ/GspJ family protein [Clostridium chromiireducens]|uniref:PulJ/GspJ family protein n=1 Tax=Clostridium chromiireducens TaxID=225345 RepID=UPI003AF4A6C9
MKNYSKKYEGFTLIEVVISMAILSIISIAVYNGFVIITNQIKAGQVKQSVTLEGKNLIEKMKATDFVVPSVTTDAALKIGDQIELQKEENEDGDIFYTRYLKEDFSVCPKEVSKYVEKVTLTPTNVTLNDEQIRDELKNTNNINYKVYIGRASNATGVEDYIKHEIRDTPKVLESDSNKIVVYVYFETSPGSANERTITIKDSKGTTLLETTETLADTTSSNPSKVNLCMNFDYYKKIDDSNLNGVEAYVYNRTGSAANIYLQKDSTVRANVTVCKGEINIYDNRAEDSDEDKMGTLYDIKLEISDYLKYKNGGIHEDKDNLFTGYSKKNTH